MFYSETDRAEASRELTKRRLRVIIPATLLFALAIASFVWYRLHRDETGWWVTGLINLLAGGYFLFFYEVYLRPVSQYKKHVCYMLDNRKRETIGVFNTLGDQVEDHNGLDCVSFTVNVDEKGAPEGDRLFYLDALKTVPSIPLGTRVKVFSNDRMVAGIDVAPKET